MSVLFLEVNDALMIMPMIRPPNDLRRLRGSASDDETKVSRNSKEVKDDIMILDGRSFVLVGEGSETHRVSKLGKKLCKLHRLKFDGATR